MVPGVVVAGVVVAGVVVAGVVVAGVVVAGVVVAGVVVAGGLPQTNNYHMKLEEVTRVLQNVYSQVPPHLAPCLALPPLPFNSCW